MVDKFHLKSVKKHRTLEQGRRDGGIGGGTLRNIVTKANERSKYSDFPRIFIIFLRFSWISLNFWISLKMSKFLQIFWEISPKSEEISLKKVEALM